MTNNSESIQDLLREARAMCDAATPGPLTPAQLEILQHSLGVDQYGQGAMYRNHFIAGEDDAQVCRALVALGMMREYPPSELTGGDPLFLVTKAGKSAVREYSPKPPKLTAAQQRYREWLKVSDVYPDWDFGDWLRHRMLDLAMRELNWIERKPIEQIRASLARKQDADLVCVVEPEVPRG